MFRHVKPVSIAIFLVFLFLGFGCATAPSPGPGVDREPASPSLSGPDQPQLASSSGKGSEVAHSPNRIENRLMSSIKRALDSGKGVEPEKAGQLIEMVPGSSYGRFLAGTIYLRNQDIDNAKKQFLRSSELDPANDHALSALGGIALKAGDLTGADLYYAKAHEAAATPVTANRLALLRIRGGHLESAREILSKTLADDPEDIMTRNNLAIALDMMGSTSGGIDILAGDNIADPHLLRTRALLQLKEGRPDRALKDLEIGIEAGGLGEEWLLMGTADLQQGRLTAAENKFHSAIVARPSGYEGYLNLGLTLRRQGKFTEAEKIYQEGLSKVSHSDLHLNLGVLYEL